MACCQIIRVELGGYSESGTVKLTEMKGIVSGNSSVGIQIKGQTIIDRSCADIEDCIRLRW